MRLASLSAFAVGLAGIAASAWEPIRCPEVDRTSADRYDTVRVVSSFESGTETWHAFNGQQQPQTSVAIDQDRPHSGQSSLRTDATFDGEKALEYVCVGPDLAIPEPGIGIGFWFRQKGTPLSLRMRVTDASGETHQFDLPRDYAGDPAKEWCYVATMLDAPANAWGGDGNRKLDYPCKLQSIIGDRPKRGFKGGCTLWLDDVAMVRPRPRRGELSIEAENKRLGNIYLPGERISLRVKGPGDTVSWQWQDFFGTTHATGQGSAQGVVASNALPLPGYYQCVFELRDGKGIVDQRVFRFAIPAPAANPRRNDFLGFCTHFQRVSAWPPEGLDLFARYGFGHLRDELSWGSVERKKGTYAINQQQAAYLARARALGIAPLVILDYANPHYDDHGFPNSPEAIAGFARYAGFMAKTLADRVDSWEVWNEWTGGCGMRGRPGVNSPENYARLIQPAYAAVKEANPKATLIGIGGEHSEHHLKSIEGMMRGGAAQAMDAFSVHSYRYPRTPEATDLVGEIQNVARLARDCGAPERIWITEIGWPTHVGPRGCDEFKQARMMVRTLALLWGTGVVERVYWYDFKNDGNRREYNENNFGVVWHQSFNWAPKPAAVAASVFARMTAGGSTPVHWVSGDVQGLCLDLPDNTQQALVWTTGEPVGLSVDGVEKAWNLMGNPVSLGNALRLDGNPIYISGNKLALRP